MRLNGGLALSPRLSPFIFLNINKLKRACSLYSAIVFDPVVILYQVAFKE